MKRLYIFFDAESKIYRKIHKVWHVNYLPYSNEQIDTARRTFKTYAKQNNTYYKNHGAIILAPIIENNIVYSPWIIKRIGYKKAYIEKSYE